MASMFIPLSQINFLPKFKEREKIPLHLVHIQVASLKPFPEVALGGPVHVQIHHLWVDSGDKLLRVEIQQLYIFPERGI
ncbi:MAG: hypothetical protein ACI4O6_03475, partial [Dysosmobacter sp.]